MDYRDTPDEAAFRTEVRTFIQNEAPKNMARGEGFGGVGEGWKTWVKKLADRGKVPEKERAKNWARGAAGTALPT